MHGNGHEGTRLQAGLLVARVVTGVVFAAHGGQKLFQYGIAGVTESFEGMGVPMAAVAAPAVSVIEFVGGIALALGVLTRLAAPALAVVMLGATLLVHRPNGFFLPGGMEFTLTLASVAILFALAGPGRYSVDGRRAAR